jgi:hypothetical protein
MSHLTAEGDSRKVALIEEIRAEGSEPHLVIVQHRLPDEQTALRIEAALIDLRANDGCSKAPEGEMTRCVGRSHSLSTNIPHRESLLIQKLACLAAQ